MMRALRVVVAGAAMAILGGAFAQDRLPRPPELEPAIQFWTRIYTEVPSDDGLIHDNRDLSRIYARIHLPRELNWRERKRRLASAKDSIGDALRALAVHPDDPRNAAQRKMRALFPKAAGASVFIAAIDRMRFQRGLSDRFEAGIRRSGRWLAQIRGTLLAHDVPLELAALPHVESSFRTGITSHAGAVGLWQFTRHTAKRFMRVDEIVDDRLDPWRSTESAARLLAYNYQQLGDWALAITAYNHGVNGMRRAVRTVGERSIARIIDEYHGPYFGFASRNFYPALLAAWDVSSHAERYFGPVERDVAPVLMDLEVPDFVRFSDVAASLPQTAERLRELNPGLSTLVVSGRKFIPKGYRLRVPAGDRVAMQASLEAIPLVRRYTAQRPDLWHRVASGQTLSAIASRYGVSSAAIARVNHLRDSDYLRVGQRLRLPADGPMPVALTASEGKGGVTRYRVRRGDTLAAIGRRFGLSATQLARLNGIEDPNSIRVGQAIRVVSRDEIASALAYSGGEG